ncbi:FMN-dependent NADH-azoreductase [Actinokineospora bangkokensis]|uniref:FMN dependent NADH:quinone oxidoreductase n=1 Tax=Actinokineospora bangkokensis TaxID=1193682 RepID=A0A1Q9LK68_9PSEU|nr:NAD(P)H-dependent oxidoreductase [Actinokineospora bangkokensis]OLR92436.1 ACP phosphodiesterase [Actinokineospora bangkokensis]
MSLFRIHSSIRQQGSVSRAVADTLESAWREAHPDSTTTERDLVADPLPGDLWTTALSAAYAPEDQRTPAQVDAVAQVTALADEVLAADALVVTAPLYNFGVPQHLKAWIDALILDPRFGPGTTPLTGKQVAIVIARGGGYGEGTPRHGWDHATPYLTRIFADVWGADVTVVAAELTLAETNPAMTDLIPLAKQSEAAAHDLAATTGRTLAQKILATTTA